MQHLAQRATTLTPSLTLAIDAKAKKLKADGVDVCGFGAGEPDFDTPQHFRDAMTPATKMIILNSPGNPTGSVYSREELQALAEVALEEDILMLSDEIYEKITYDNTEFVSLASLSTEIYESTITVNG